VSIRIHFLEHYIPHLLTFGDSLEDSIKAKGDSEQIGPGSIYL